MFVVFRAPAPGSQNRPFPQKTITGESERGPGKMTMAQILAGDVVCDVAPPLLSEGAEMGELVWKRLNGRRRF